MPHSPALTPPAAPVWRPHQPANLCPGLRPVDMWRRLQPANAACHRRGFTLVELMVVIGIIGLLTAISVPVVMKALASARTAAIKAEIDMLHMAIMNYKAEYGAFPPCIDTRYDGDNGYIAAGEASKHVKRLFPRCTNVPAQLNSAPAWILPNPTLTPDDAFWLARLYGGVNNIPAGRDLHLIPQNALYLWLSGYNENDPTSPLIGPSRAKLYDFDSSRVRDNNYYAPPRKPGSPYIYIDSANYQKFPAPTTPSSGVIGAEIDVGIIGNPADDAFFNEDTFQILCAGADEIFGTDDDLSNFWPGTRKDYEDSRNR